jgi:predicted dehydrogenase
MNRRLRVGVAGLGVGRGHAETFLALADRFELVAVCDADEDKANALAAALSVPIVCRDTTELCSLPDLDVVDICTPSFLHFAQTLEALAAGKHVILEKPVAGSLREVDALIAAEARSGKRVLPIFQYRFGAGLQKLRYLVEQGIAGQPFVATSETHWRRRDAYYAAWHGRWERELGGPIVTLAVHAHDVITSVLGPARRVFAAMATRVNPIETEDCVAATLQMASGALVTSSVTTGSARQISRLRFCFSNLTAESNTEPYAQTSDPWTFTGDSPEIDAQIAEALAAFTPRPERFAGQFLSTYDVLTGAAAPSVTLTDARASIELITALYHSAQTGLPVDLPIGSDHPQYDGWRPAAGG